ncbi:flagellar hook-length control protein FliK [Sphingomonas sp. J315]|uniref:flagellar hook-length control protein FliK n=1 Tax=Sphingomonas sp. J315 TaxID=2898433 RepID=UPI0021ADA7D3|nr:flagellar hook-length control protein FliK [Sphingomonas sp. J315]UUY01134.1 flagellar hook-length control protein FliK [Sphingomonas sp. J315]
MTDLLASTALTLSPPGFTPRAVPAAVAAGFDLTLALDCAVPGVAPPTGKPVAGYGKDLPVSADEVTDGDIDDDEALLAWMPEGLMPLPLDAPLPGRVAVGTPSAHIDGPIADTVGTPAQPVEIVEIVETAPLPADVAGVAEGNAPLFPPAPANTALAASPASTPLRTWRDPVPAQAEPSARGGAVAAEVRFDRATAATPELVARAGAVRGSQETGIAPAPAAAQIAVAPTRASVSAVAPAPIAPPAPPLPWTSQPAPAAQVFAAALAVPLGDALDPVTPADPVSPEVQMLRAVELQRTTVQAPAQADQTPLDLSRDDWTGKMIERIAALRDGVEAADTRIRLAPENLGTVDVSIRRDGDRIQIHFTAENPVTRQLLVEAAPRLAELAEARGLKMGQSSVDGGGSESRREQQPNHQSTPARPATARADTGSASDARIA